MDNKKSKKTITFPNESYIKIKEYCDENNLKITRFVEKTILSYIKQQQNKDIC